MLDRQTEIIAHFIGAFQQTTEKLAARQDYDAFRGLKLAEDEPGSILSVNVNVSSDYALDGFDPSARPYFPGDPGQPVPWLVPVDTLPRLGPETAGLRAPEFVEPPLTRFPNVPIPPDYFLTLPPPSSVIHITVQSNRLIDNDILFNRPLEISNDLYDQYGPEASAAKLVELAQVADALSVSIPPLGTSAAAQAEAFNETVQGLDPDAVPEGAEAYLFRTETILARTGTGDTMSETASETQDAPASHPAFAGAPVVNGEILEEIPDTLALRLEARHGGDDEEGDATDTPGVIDVEDGAAGSVSGQTASADPLEFTQTLETGDNLLLNQIQVAHDWIDAPVIAVGGMMQSLSLISQINVMRDLDFTPGNSAFAHGGAGDPASEAMNIASFTQDSNIAQFLNIATPTGTPLIAMTCISGDLTIDNRITQINTISDSDIVSYEFGECQAEISLGGNSVVNLETLLELGSRFDVIMVGGNMIEIAQIQQINVLLDDDLVMGGGGGAWDPALTSHGNLLWNEASLNRIGVDASAEMSARFQATLDQLAEISAGRAAGDPLSYDGTPDAGAYGAVESLFADPLLAGLGALRVLWIEGDLIIRDTLTQINLLNDADLISVDGPDGLQIAAGDNILANVAGLTIAGVDSTIMASDGVYSDAVLWQSGLIAGDQMPGNLGGGMDGLASEAVVFLADSMLGEAPALSDDEFQTSPMPDGSSSSLDAMHSVLA